MNETGIETMTGTFDVENLRQKPSMSKTFDWKKNKTFAKPWETLKFKETIKCKEKFNL